MPTAAGGQVGGGGGRAEAEAEGVEWGKWRDGAEREAALAEAAKY